MEDALGPFLGTWTLMMAAMMLPSALPMILLHRLGADGRVRRQIWSAAFVAGYLVMWASVGVVVVKDLALVASKRFKLDAGEVRYDHSGRYAAFGFFQYFGP